MVDAHCHLNFHAFEKDVDQVIKRAFDARVDKIINVGTSIESSQRAVELAQKYDNLYAIVGIHPHHADKIFSPRHPERSEGSLYGTDGDSSPAKRVRNDVSWLEELEDLAQKPKVVGIGEIGMDYYSYKSNGIVDPKRQKEVFEAQIKLAHKLKLPLQIHNRHAGKNIIDILLNHKSYLLNPPGMFHCFAGDMDFLKNALELGFYIGFDGNITYKGLAPGESVELKELAIQTPLDRILVETDSPYLTPQPHRGSRNEPTYAIITAKFIAQIKGLSFEKIVEQTTQNAEILFKLNARR